MQTPTESFVSQIILSQHINPYHSDGDVDSPTGFFGYMSFDPNEFVVDGMDVPEEFRGRTVTASVNEFGSIYYDVLHEEYLRSAGMDPEDDPVAHAKALAETWFVAKTESWLDWSGED